MHDPFVLLLLGVGEMKELIQVVTYSGNDQKYNATRMRICV